MTVRSIAFSAPMTTVNLSKDDSEFLKKVSKNSCNIIFSNDLIPHTPGHIDNVLTWAKNVLLPHLVAKILPCIMKWTAKWIISSLLSFLKLDESDKGNDKLRGIKEVCEKYKHIGTIIHYETEKDMISNDDFKDRLNKISNADDGYYQDAIDSHSRLIDKECGLARDVTIPVRTSYETEIDVPEKISNADFGDGDVY